MPVLEGDSRQCRGDDQPRLSICNLFDLNLNSDEFGYDLRAENLSNGASQGNVETMVYRPFSCILMEHTMTRHSTFARHASFSFAALLLALAAYPLLARDEVPRDTPDVALKSLRAGNARFVAGKSEHPNSDLARVEATGKDGQLPIAAVLGCADSRVPVETIFDQGVGDVFVVRVAGNVAGTTELASLEYSVDHLGVQLIVVLGHTKCGAVKAAMGGGVAPGNLPALLDQISSAVKIVDATGRKMDVADKLTATITENVRQQIAAAQRKSPSLAKAAAAGKIKFVGAVYDVDTGRVHWLDDEKSAK